MSLEPKLPDDVRKAALANQKVKAIKLLREANGIRLKEAKDLVEQFMHENVANIQPAQTSSSGWIPLILIIAIGYAAYRYFG